MTIFKAILRDSNKIRKFQKKVNINALEKRAVSLPKSLAPAQGRDLDGFDCTRNSDLAHPALLCQLLLVPGSDKARGDLQPNHLILFSYGPSSVWPGLAGGPPTE